MLVGLAMNGGTLKMTAVAQLTEALQGFDAAAKSADKVMETAESAGDVATMQKIAAEEQAARDAFYAPAGLSFNSYYHTLDRVFTSFPEILFAGDNASVQRAAAERLTAALRNATAALSR
jgi:hypothetical protein